MLTEKPQTYLCIKCNFKCSQKRDYDRHLSTRKHQNADNMFTSTPLMFTCSLCTFKCSKKRDFIRHLSTRKHTNATNMLTFSSNYGLKSPQKAQHHIWSNNKTISSQESNYPSQKSGKMPSPKFVCQCGRAYKHRQSLFRHKKNCTFINENDIMEEISETSPTFMNDAHINDKQIGDMVRNILGDNIKLIMTQNKEMFHDVLTKMIPYLQNNSTIINNTQNNQFNINVFLDNNCKDAINFSEFIESLPITPKLFDDTYENGLTKGLTNLLLDGLNNMNVLERPIHCTDLSRKVLYVKENDKWQKDNQHEIVKGGISTLAMKQRSSISIWKEANPGWDNNDNKQIVFSNLIHNALELCETQEKEQNKILKAISTNTYIQKSINS
jgi:hypothetical protein